MTTKLTRRQTAMILGGSGIELPPPPPPPDNPR